MKQTLRHLVPLDNENRWSDLLAVLIERDPRVAAEVFGWTFCDVTVTREWVSGTDRIDLIACSGGTVLGAIENKVLHGLDLRQLMRYEQALPTAERYLVVYPRRLGISVTGVWRALPWETVLDSFSTSEDAWVAETAEAWRELLETSLPNVNGSTVWNEFAEGEHFPIAIRTRCAWVFGQLTQSADVDLVIGQSSAGVSPVVKMSTPAAVSGYLVAIEFEERWNSRDWPKFAVTPSLKVIGPSIKVCLIQTNVDTSAGFDWDYLHSLWPTMASARSDWVKNKPRLRATHDKAGYQRMVDAGAPPYLGIGFGEAQTARTRECMFGARIQLPPNISLSTLAHEMESLEPLLRSLARVAPRR